MSVNDYWSGLSRLWKSSLRLVDPDCPTRCLLHHSQHPKPLLTEFQEAAQQEQVNLDLLLAIARQESRFSPAVASPVGAQGLLQLMPATAAEMAGEELSTEQLRQPDLNAVLGARYLASCCSNGMAIPGWSPPATTLVLGLQGHGSAQNWSRTLNFGQSAFPTRKHVFTRRKCSAISGPITS